MHETTERETKRKNETVAVKKTKKMKQCTLDDNKELGSLQKEIATEVPTTITRDDTPYSPLSPFWDTEGDHDESDTDDRKKKEALDDE